MGSGLLRWSRAIVVALAVVVLGATAVAGAATRGSDMGIARAGVFVSSDFPPEFKALSGSNTTASETISLAKGVDGCAPYISLLKTSIALPQAKSSRFGEDSRAVSNEVAVYASERAATAALTLYAKSSVVGCIENLAEKQARQDPALRDSLDDVVVTLERQDIAGLGDDRVVYEGGIDLTGTDGSTSRIGVGSAAVQVGRAVNVVTYTTDGADLTEVLGPAIDASVVRLRAALAKSST